ncbi:OB-fold nucleic acid binding domain-containing protein [Escherichia coli]
MSEQHAQGADAVVDLNNELKTRREKLATCASRGSPSRTISVAIIPLTNRTQNSTKENEELEALNIEVAVAGRMMTRRIMGKASFVTLEDVGGRIQLYVARGHLPEGVYNEQFKNGTSVTSSARKVTCSKPKPANCLSTVPSCVC